MVGMLRRQLPSRLRSRGDHLSRVVSRFLDTIKAKVSGEALDPVTELTLEISVGYDPDEAKLLLTPVEYHTNAGGYPHLFVCSFQLSGHKGFVAVVNKKQTVWQSGEYFVFVDQATEFTRLPLDERLKLLLNSL